MILKWIFDRVVALIGLLFLWPVLLVVAIMVKVKMPGGPAIFTQKRVGKGGKLFTCHKFRSMTVAPKVQVSEGSDGSPSTGSGQASVSGGWSSVSVAGDSRITPFGATLRHYKLDELPGLWDVLIGNMSFVGPRPDVPGYADKLVGNDRDVLKLRPGITGPATLKYRLEDEMLEQFCEQVSKGFPSTGSGQAQVSDGFPSTSSGQALVSEGLIPEGFKGNLPDFSKMSTQELAVWYNDNVIYPDKVRLNCYYYRHYSFVKDIEMIFATVLGWKISYMGEEI